MKLHPRVSRTAVELVKSFEGFRARAVPAGDGWIIGYGHTVTAREGTSVSERDAEALLWWDLSEVGRALDTLVYAPLNPNQFNALAAFGFNIGVENLRRSSALRRVNEGNYLVAAAAIEQWRKADLGGDSQVVDALVRRRAAEKALFLTPVEGFPRAPTHVLRPQFDPEPLSPDIPAPLPGLHDDEEPSRSLAAAANVSARLQQLVPEPAAAPEARVPVSEAPAEDWRTPQLEPEAAELPPVIEHAAEPELPVEEFEPVAPPVIEEFDEGAADAEEAAEDDAPLEFPAELTTPSLEIVFEPEAPPPPFEEEAPPPPPADDLFPPASDEAEAEAFSLEEVAPPPPEDAEPAVHPARAAAPRLVLPEGEEAAQPSGDTRRAAAPLALVGVVLFLGALVSIWQGQPSLLPLVVGLIGVACMAGGYFLWTGAAAKGEGEAEGASFEQPPSNETPTDEPIL